MAPNSGSRFYGLDPPAASPLSGSGPGGTTESSPSLNRVTGLFLWYDPPSCILPPIGAALASPSKASRLEGIQGAAEPRAFTSLASSVPYTTLPALAGCNEPGAAAFSGQWPAAEEPSPALQVHELREPPLPHHDKAPAVRRHIAVGVRDGGLVVVHREEWSAREDPQRRAGLYARSDHLRFARPEAPIEQLAAVTRPHRLASTVLGDQQLSGRPVERSQVDLRAVGLVRGVRQPTTIRRERGKAFVVRSGDDRFHGSRTLERYRHDVPSGRPVPHSDAGAPVRRHRVNGDLETVEVDGVGWAAAVHRSADDPDLGARGLRRTRSPAAVSGRAVDLGPRDRRGGACSALEGHSAPRTLGSCLRATRRDEMGRCPHAATPRASRRDHARGGRRRSLSRRLWHRVSGAERHGGARAHPPRLLCRRARRNTVRNAGRSRPAALAARHTGRSGSGRPRSHRSGELTAARRSMACLRLRGAADADGDAKAGRGPTRSVGATVILVNGAIAAYLARGDRQLITFLPDAEPDRSKAGRAIARVLIDRARAGGDAPRGMLIEEIDGVPPSRHPMSPWLTEAGFVGGAMGFQASFRNAGGAR